MEGTQAPGFGAAKYSPSGQLCWTNATSSSNPCGTPPSGATAYGYDASGDRLFGGATNTLGWHQESSQLCYSVTSGSGTCAAPPSGASTYTYDSTGRRTSETVGFWTGTFTWDQAQTSLLSDGTSSFLYGPSGSAPIEQITGSGAGAVADLLISDQIGNTRGLVRISGSTLVGVLTNTTDYDAYGNAIVGQGQAAEPGGVSTQETALNTNYVDSTPFGYGSGYTDPSGLVYLVHRYYDPTTGQFVSQDPLVDQTASPYGYAGGDPVAGMDPLGLCWVVCTVWNDTAGFIVHGIKVGAVDTWHAVYSGSGSVARAARSLGRSLSHLSALFNSIAEIADVVAVVASSLAWLPGVGQIAEVVAITAGAVALVADGANCLAAHDCNIAAMSLDILSVIPGISALHAGIIMKNAEKTLDALKASRKLVKRDLVNALKQTRSSKEIWHFAAGKMSSMMGVGATAATFSGRNTSEEGNHA